MYEPAVDENWLYTGDVIRDLQLPNIKTEDFRLVSTAGNGREYSVRSIMSQSYFVFLSHECDFNNDKRQFVILAPMLGVDARLRRLADAYHRLRASNDVENHPHYLNMFYYSPSDPAFPDEKIVDFTRVISFPRSRAEELLPKKCLQLDAEHRRLIKAKLGYYYFHEEECPITLE